MRTLEDRHRDPDTVKLGGWLYVPLKYLTSSEVQFLQERLIYRNPFPRLEQHEDGSWESYYLDPIILYDMRLPGHIGVPRAFGLHRYGHLDIDDFLTDGFPLQGEYKRPDSNNEAVKDPEAQAQFMDDLFTAANEHHSFLATAPTGSGKTVSALDMAIRRGRTTLILVHLERLMDQWINEAIIPIIGGEADRIGIVQGPKCDFEGKDFVVGMLHSLNLRTYPREFYRYFGTVIFDEVHKIGTNFFAPTCPMFTARVKVGLSATLDRRDKGDKIFTWHLGPTRVRSGAEALPMKVYVRKYSRPSYKKDHSSMGSFCSSLARDSKRNQVIAGLVKRMHDKDRNALVVSHSVKHLQVLMGMCKKLGVPEESIGQFTGQRFVWEKNDEGKRVLKKKKIPIKHLTFVKAHAKIIFATYGMMTEGIDIPRLDAGIDVVPRGSATQLIGRIRRPLPGKKEPIWVTILDEDTKMAKRFFKGRLKDYRNSNAEVIGHG